MHCRGKSPCGWPIILMAMDYIATNDAPKAIGPYSQAVLAAAGATFANVTRATVFLTDLGNFQTLNGIYAEYFGDHKPSRSTVGVAALPKGANVEIDLIAVV